MFVLIREVRVSWSVVSLVISLKWLIGITWVVKIAKVFIILWVNIVTKSPSRVVAVVNVKVALFENVRGWLLWVRQFVSLAELWGVDHGNIIAIVLC